MKEKEIRQLLRAVPVERRMQARAAVTGSVGDLIDQVRSVRALPDGGRQAALSALFMAEFAARCRLPDQVAQVAIKLHRDYGGSVALDAAAVARPPLDLAEIAAELDCVLSEPIGDARWSAAHGSGLAELFLRSVAARRLPGDLAEMMKALARRGPLRGALIVLTRTATSDEIAHVVLHLRGTKPPDLVDEIAALIVRPESGVNLAAVLAGLDRFGDRETVEKAIDIVTTCTASPAAAQTTNVVVSSDVNRIADLVSALLQERQPELARLAVTYAIRNFAQCGQQHRLYALFFVFKQHGLHDEAEQIRNEISASPPHDEVEPHNEVEMITKFCEDSADRPQDIVSLIEAILENPKPGVTAHAAFQLFQNLTQVRPYIFAAVSSWTYDGLREFEKLLRGSSVQLADDFREDIANHAYKRNDADDIGEIILWLLRDVRGEHGKAHLKERARKRASQLVAGAVRRRDPDLMVKLICKLRDYQDLPGDQHEGWWTVRDAAEKEIAMNYEIDDMTRLVKAGADLCLPALLRLAPEWLTHVGRKDADVVRLVKALNDTQGDLRELAQMLAYSGRTFSRADGTSPAKALRAAHLEGEANAWNNYKFSMKPWPGRRPDPDPRRLRS